MYRDRLVIMQLWKTYQIDQPPCIFTILQATSRPV
jgi:hypothetical protein